MHIDQIVVGATVGDAVTESALRIRDALRAVVDSDLYALHVDDRLEGNIGRIERYPLPEHRSANDIIVFHVSIGDDRLTDFILHRGERLVLVYHNITPARFFGRFDPEFAAYLDHGRRRLPLLLRKAECVIADSSFNASELQSLGRSDVHITPPPLNLARLVEVEPDPAVVESFERNSPGKMILFVGQVLPHKRPDILLGAHHVLTTNYFPDARLVIAGPNRNPRYAEALRGYLAATNLDTVWITGELTDAQLAAFFRRADVLVTASEHEGFCVPVVEAFHFDVPVVARGFGAIPETAGDAALVLPPDTGARHLAEAIRRVIEDERLRMTLIERGRERRRAFTVDATLAGTLRILRDLISTPAAVAT